MIHVVAKIQERLHALTDTLYVWFGLGNLQM